MKYKRIKSSKGYVNDNDGKKDRDNINEDEKEESAFVGFQKEIKGRCYGYGDFGHWKDVCPKLRRYHQTNNNTSGRFNGNCYYYGKRGHRREDYSKLKNKLERERNSKMKMRIMQKKQEWRNCFDVLRWEQCILFICLWIRRSDWSIRKNPYEIFYELNWKNWERTKKIQFQQPVVERHIIWLTH